ncbi:MAG TPA: alkaline phosphatase family protein [Candidatus Methylomirabilis sp.]|nr:alkaline phosphatase family protein [Candidatus Methylomirabilis sp.]
MFLQRGLARCWKAAAGILVTAIFLPVAMGQATRAGKIPRAQPDRPTKLQTILQRPRLVVLLVVDQMRSDYVDKFQGQWTGGLKRLVEEGAWFRDAAYPYAATETCVGHSTISTGAFPATHGMVANAWWDRESQKMVTCTADPQANNIGYAGLSVKGGDSAARMMMPAFAEELKFQTGNATRVVTFSLKARASITMAGHKADAATWFDPAAGAWETSSVYGTAPFVEAYAKTHPAREDYGKTWSLALPESAYFYDKEAKGAGPPAGAGSTFPHPLRGKSGGPEPDAAYYEEWQASPYADTALTKLAETAVDSLNLGKGGGTDFLAIGYSPLDYVGHAFGPRSWEVQDVLIRLDKNLGELFAYLDKKVGREKYVVALSADHGVVPIPEDMQQTGADAGRLHLPEVQEQIEKTLDAFNYPEPAVARITGSDVYFAPGIYERLKSDPRALEAVADAIKSVPGVEGVYLADDLADRPSTHNPLREAMATSYFAGRSGDLFIVPKAYWLLDSRRAGAEEHGTGHGTPWNYDQHVPVLLMGFGIRPGEYFDEVTPADIAPTLAALCGVTLASRDGHVLKQALTIAGPSRTTPKSAVNPCAPQANP